jgi:hypothetical protein
MRAAKKNSTNFVAFWTQEMGMFFFWKYLIFSDLKKIKMMGNNLGSWSFVPKFSY